MSPKIHYTPSSSGLRCIASRRTMILSYADEEAPPMMKVTHTILPLRSAPD